jgi:predicted enzyme related to lactoylglutathione lyase
MLEPVYYVELHSPDATRTEEFFAKAFGWEFQPFATPDYLVAAHGDGPGVDAGLTASQDGRPRTVPIVRVESLADACERVTGAGGTVVVEAFTIAGVGRGCYVADPAGVLVGLHEYDPTAA